MLSQEETQQLKDNARQVVAIVQAMPYELQAEYVSYLTEELKNLDIASDERVRRNRALRAKLKCSVCGRTLEIDRCFHGSQGYNLTLDGTCWKKQYHIITKIDRYEFTCPEHLTEEIKLTEAELAFLPK